MHGAETNSPARFWTWRTHIEPNTPSHASVIIEDHIKHGNNPFFSFVLYWYSPAVHPLSFGRAEWCCHNQSVHHSAPDFPSHVCCPPEDSRDSVVWFHSQNLKTNLIMKVLRASQPLTHWEEEVVHIIVRTSNMLMFVDEDFWVHTQPNSHQSEHFESEFLTAQEKWYLGISKISYFFWRPILSTLRVKEYKV